MHEIPCRVYGPVVGLLICRKWEMNHAWSPTEEIPVETEG